MLTSTNLKKALLYDRGQYKEGYADGVREFAEKLKEKADSNEIWVAGKTFTFYMIREDYLDNLVKEMAGEIDV